MNFIHITRLLLFLIFSVFLSSDLLSQITGFGDAYEVTGKKPSWQLTSGKEHQKGWIVYDKFIDLNQPFSLQFKASFGNKDNGGEGISFFFSKEIITQDKLIGGKFSLQGLSHTFGFEFDTHCNLSNNDPVEDHVAFIEHGQLNHPQDYAKLPNLEDGKLHAITLDWKPVKKSLTVTVDGYKVLSVKRNVVTEYFGGHTNAFLHIGASTSKLKNTQYIERLIVKNENAKIALPIVKTTSKPVKPMLSDTSKVLVSESLPVSVKKEEISLEEKLKKAEVGDKVVLENIHFVKGSDTLLSTSEENLSKTLLFLKEQQNYVVEISGHTDNVGLYHTNLALSLARARRIRTYLINEGIDEARLKYKGYASSMPVAKNDTEENRAKNRRVEVRILEK